MHHYLSQFSELNGPGYVKMAWVYGTGAVSGWAGSSEGSAAQHMPGWPTPWLTAEAVNQSSYVRVASPSGLHCAKYGGCVPRVTFRETGNGSCWSLKAQKLAQCHFCHFLCHRSYRAHPNSGATAEESPRICGRV